MALGGGLFPMSEVPLCRFGFGGVPAAMRFFCFRMYSLTTGFGVRGSGFGLRVSVFGFGVSVFGFQV